MAKVAVTGASGFVGSNLVRLLYQAGHAITALRRPISNCDHLKDLPLTWITGDITDRLTLADAFHNQEVVFHCAGLVSFARARKNELERVNVEGTRAVVETAQQCRVSRLVHCSSVDAFGVTLSEKLINEETRWNLDQLGLEYGYARTKYEGQKIVLAAAKKGLDAVVVNPSFMLGPYDPKPTSGKLILEIAKGWGFAAPRGSNNFVDVRDVCQGMVQAWKQGRSGECYILGGENLTYRAIFTEIASLLGVRKPRITAPRTLVMLLGYAGDLINYLGYERDVTKAIALVTSIERRYSIEKAKRALGYQPGAIIHGIKAAAKWFIEQGKI